MIKYVCTQVCAHILINMGGEAMLLRIGEKVINKQKVYHTVEHILHMRSQGFSQQETANRLHLDRTFIRDLKVSAKFVKVGEWRLSAFPLAIVTSFAS